MFATFAQHLLTCFARFFCSSGSWAAMEDEDFGAEPAEKHSDSTGTRDAQAVLHATSWAMLTFVLPAWAFVMMWFMDRCCARAGRCKDECCESILNVMTCVAIPTFLVRFQRISRQFLGEFSVICGDLSATFRSFRLIWAGDGTGERGDADCDGIPGLWGGEFQAIFGIFRRIFMFPRHFQMFFLLILWCFCVDVSWICDDASVNNGIKMIKNDTK
jgi:hypothetical protein